MSGATPNTRRADRVGLATASVMTLLLLVMLGRVAQLQLHPSRELQEQFQPRVSTRQELPTRGDLLDQRGRLLATTRFASRVYVDPTLLKDPDQAIVALARVLNLPEEKLGERIIGAVEENARRKAVNDAIDKAELASRGGPKQSGVLDHLISPAGLFGGPSKPSAQADAGLSPVLEGAAEQPPPDVVVDGGAPVETNATDNAPAKRKLIRYLPIGGVIEDDVAAAIKQLKLQGVHTERRTVRVPVGGDEVASLVGKVGTDVSFGLEHRFEEKLEGKKGSVSFYRDALGRPLWVEPGQVQPAQSGADVRLSIDLELQRIALEELERGVDEAQAAGGRLVVIKPDTGEILAMCDIVKGLTGLQEYPWEDDPQPTTYSRNGKPGARPARKTVPVPVHRGPARYATIREDPARKIHPALARNRCIEDIYEPGSTFKPFVWSTITELGLARPDEVFDTESGRWRTSYGRALQDVTKRETMTWCEVLINSSNIGMVKGAERLSARQLHDAVVRFGFGSRTNLDLPGEASGLVTSLNKWTIYSQTSYAIGHEVAVTPLQMVRAFSAFARTGEQAGTLCNLRLTAVSGNEPQVGVRYRVLPGKIAELTRVTMHGVAENVEKKMQSKDAAQTGWRYSMFGKSGTAKIPLGAAPPGKRLPRGASGYYDDQYSSSFIAGGPTEDPKLIVLTVIDDPGPELVFANPGRHYGSLVAGPVVRRVMERALTYLGVPPSPQIAQVHEEPRD